MHKERTDRFIAGRALAETALSALEAECIRKAVFAANDTGNAFREHLGFSVRTDLTYCNRELSCAPAADSAPESAARRNVMQFAAADCNVFLKYR